MNPNKFSKMSTAWWTNENNGWNIVWYFIFVATDEPFVVILLFSNFTIWLSSPEMSSTYFLNMSLAKKIASIWHHCFFVLFYETIRTFDTPGICLEKVVQFYIIYALLTYQNKNEYLKRGKFFNWSSNIWWHL